MIEVIPNTIEKTRLAHVVQQYGCTNDNFAIERLGGGLINSTWKVAFDDIELVLQKVNTNVFSSPTKIAYNIEAVNSYLKKHAPEYYFPAPLLNAKGDSFYKDANNNWFRAFKFLKGSQTISIVENAGQAYEAAKEFGRFSALLTDFPAEELHENIVGFHDLTKRYNDFLAVLKTGDPVRLEEAKEWIEQVLNNADIVQQFDEIVAKGLIKKRVTHHDTKISNVLFNPSGKAFAVIDLDTIMAGYYISDVGDMMRTYLSVIGEEEQDFDTVDIRLDVYQAIKKGYMSEMALQLTPTEQSYFYYSGEFIIFMQAIRFLSDYLSGDHYYTPAYPGHNFKRAQHQLQLLKSYRSIPAAQR
jgi:thiamine kinase-like enzyme